MKRRTRILSVLAVIMAAAVLFAGVAFAASSTYSKYTGKNYNHDAAFANYLIVDGIDVSAFQENIDWKKVKAEADKIGIAMDEREFHCKGEFKGLHKGRPNEEDMQAVAEFAKKIIE